ncbi:MAG TPA: efflux RND transporter periplasmic adaptor subunit [Dehalococcoidia bacterium]|nr:efflux RND transporter periplasmic adaptor subunit [Candidatus Acidoferrales bacterium]HLE80096.1 efflux RND transporter periplasmic adaptor subunit [Dehalococcoidia bacterium]
MKRRGWWLAGVLAMGLGAVGCGDEAGGQRATAPAPVSAATPAAGPALPPSSSDTLEILSVLTVEREVDLLAQRDGVVVEIAKDEGSWVEAGAVLASLDDRELAAQLSRARAELDAAQSNVKYNQAEVKARQAAHRRAQEMYKLGLNSQADLEEAEFKAQGAAYDLEAWEAVVQRTHADIRVLELELEKMRIQTPFRGIVARRYIRVGENVLKDDKCFRISQLAPLQVRFLVPETASRPQTGDSVNVAPVSDSQRVYTARVLKISPTVDAASGSYDVTAELTGQDLTELRPGMSVRVFWRSSTPAP